MPRAQPILTNFTAGELGPRLQGRIDQSRYLNGCRTLENMVVWPQGPAERRPGTRYIADVKTPAHPVRLLAFEYSTEQAYIIEAGPFYVRFYKDGGRIESPPGTPVEVATPYAAADLARLKLTQSADVLYLFHPAHAPRKLMRTSHTSWSLTIIDWIDGPYLEENTDPGKTLIPSATAGAIILDAAGHAPFAATDVGRLVRLKHGATWGYAKITSVASASQATADVRTAFADTAATAAWRLGLWSDTTGWPTCGTFHEERLVLAGARIRPHRIDGSRSGEFENFTPGVDDADPLAYTIGSDQVNAIRWLASWRQLLIGTLGAEFHMGSQSQTQGLTPTNVLVRRNTRHGCADVAPQAIGDGLVFLQRQGRKLREILYSYEVDGYQATDLTAFWEHIGASGIADMAFQQEPAAILWAARRDGALIGCTRYREHGVVGWHRHPLGGGGAVEALAAIPGAGADELWLAVRRTVAGQTRRTIERLEPMFADDQSQADAWFVDCGLSYAGPPTTTIGGLAHLEGETVHLLTDGAVHPPRRVAGGQVSLDRPAARVIAGLPYTSRLETMPLEAGQAEGTAQGRRQRIDRVVVRLYRSLGCKLGVDPAALDEVPFRLGGHPMDAPPPLFTGDKRLAVAGSYEQNTVWVVQDLPLPLTVIALMPRVVAYD